MNVAARGSIQGALAAILLIAPAVHAQEEWRGAATENFRYAGTGPERDFQSAAARLEGFEASLRQLFAGTALRPLPRTTVILPAEGERIEELESVDRRLFEGTHATYAFLPDGSEGRPLDAFFHEYVHALARRNIPNAPLWLVEGLAAFFSTADWSADGRQFLVGRAIEPYARQVRDDRRRLGFDALAAISTASEDYDDVRRDSIFHAQSWALVHYMMTRESGLARTAEFVRLAASETPFEQAIEEAFNVNFRALLQDFEDTVRRRGDYPTLALTIEGLTRDGVQPAFRRIEPAEAETELARLLIAAGLPEEAEVHITRALRVDPDRAGPHTLRGFLRLENQQLREARESLERAIAGEGADHFSYYYYALALLADDPPSGSPALMEARAALNEALRLDQTFADGYHALALTYLARNEDLDEAVQLLDDALERSPGHPEYLITLGRILIAGERFDTARTVLAPLLEARHDAAIRDEARSMLASIEGRRENRGLTGEGFAEILSGGNRGAAEAGPPPPPPGPTISDERVRLTRVVRGEQQKGRLTLIDCRDGLSVTVEDAAATYVFHTASPERVEFARSTAGIGEEIACGPVDPPAPVVVTFRPAPEGSPYAGVPEKIEFVDAP